MSYKIYLHPELPTIISEIGSDFHLKEDMENIYKDLLRLLDDAGHPVYYITDIAEARLTFGEIVMGMGAGASIGGVLRHPNLREIIIVSSSEIIKLGVKALSQAQYGQVKARLTSTRDEALGFIQTETSTI